MKSRTRLPVRSDTATAVKLKLDKTFQPCSAEPDDELFPNGIFEFNITRLLAFVESDVERFPIERVAIDGIPNYGGENLDEETLGTADLLRPIILAEIVMTQPNLLTYAAKANASAGVFMPSA